ncbi:hypothetical protein IFT73_11765 [Aeromicrobium sp. CFBP 8757]|uniref:hypothetical protein n=1 Tax=Aeromicrobium sp. CFBP 8757 TaxID=2775288 RepID=UPI0017827D1F|nr:hypothetical protein [Aeromicrobium sp. CFBP 8757]MBD8607536.1 hypothetical protein [Aeromicrobium sp. CFBP 8757]
MTRRPLVLLAVVTALVAAACTAGSEAPSPRRRPTATVVTVGAGTTVPAMVEGTDYRVVRDVPAEIGGETMTYYAVRDDGSSAVAVRYPSDKDQQTAGAPSPDRLLTVDLETGGTKALFTRDDDSELTDITEVSRGNGYLVWLQSAPDSYSSLTWDLYSYDLATKTERRIASSAELGIDDPPWPSFESIRPQIVGDDVYWAAVEAVKGNTPATAIYRAPLDGADPMTKVIDDATDVYADGGDLWFQRDGQMLAWDASEGAEKKAGTAAVHQPCGGYFHEGTLVQIDCGGKGSLVVTEKSGRRTTLRDVDGPGYLNATSRWVGYSIDGQAYVYDLSRQRLMRMKGAQGYSAQDFSGNRMFYIQQHSGTADDPHDATYPYIALLPE